MKANNALKQRVLLGVLLVALSALCYALHYLIFHDAHHIFIYLVGDIAFVFIEVLMVTLVIHMEHLKADYPYLFSLAVRTNPFDPNATIQLQ